MTQCDYTKPHPKHHWWIDGTTTPVSNYQQCEGVRDPNLPFGESGRLTHSKQALGEWEIWEREQRSVGAASHIANAHHLHFLYLRGGWEWVLRWSTSPLCKTPRCRLVTIKEVPDAPKQDV